MTERVQFEERMSEADALIWSVEADPTLRSTILSVWILDQAPDAERFQAQLERASREIPRLRQRAVTDALGLAPPGWELDPYFDLGFHVRRVRVPAPGTERALLDMAQPIAMQAFDKDRPLWELYLVEGMEDGRTAVIMKLHHAVSDGVGLVRMTESMIERTREADPRQAARPVPPAPEARERSAWERTREAFEHGRRQRRARAGRMLGAIGRSAAQIARDPAGEARRVVESAASIKRLLTPASAPESAIMRGRSLGVRFDSVRVPLEELKRAGKAVGGTVNDAFVAAVAGGLQRYHQNHGAPVEALRMQMPVDMRGGERADEAGNQFAPARFLVPTAITSPAERIKRIGAIVREQRAEPALPLIEEISGALSGLPVTAITGLFGGLMKATDFTTSNVRGPRRPTYVSGAKVERILPFGPLAGAAANITVFSYDGGMHVGINTDPAAVADPELLLECLRKGFDEVLAVV